MKTMTAAERKTLARNAVNARWGKGEKMKRRREQCGTVYSKCGAWYVRYSDFRVIDGEVQRKRLAKQLGAVDDMNKKEAKGRS